MLLIQVCMVIITLCQIISLFKYLVVMSAFYKIIDQILPKLGKLFGMMGIPDSEVEKKTGGVN